MHIRFVLRENIADGLRQRVEVVREEKTSPLSVLVSVAC